MHCVDTSFLIDYLNGEQLAEDCLAVNEGETIHVPTEAIFEIYRGVLRAELPGGLEEATDALEWTVSLPFSDPAARETARVEHELRGSRADQLRR